MSQKTTRSAAELRAVAAELCNSKDFLQTICEYVTKCAAKANAAKFEPLEKSVDQNKKAIDELKCVKEENEELKTIIGELKKEIISLKSKQSVKTVNKDKKLNLHNADKRVVRIDKDSAGPSRRGSDSQAPAESFEQIVPPVAEKGEDDFIMKTRRRRKPDQKIGTAHIDVTNELLTGVSQPKTAWFYVGRIKNKDVTVTDMLNYLKGNNGGVDFKVEKLESKGPFAAFKVGAPFNMLDELNNENYWPCGVCIRRFNFWNSAINSKERATFLENPTRLINN